MDQNQTKEPRPPVNLRIKFRSENVEQFIERYAVDVSRGGIFIRTRDPLAVGTQLRLDFQFQNGTALMAGEGTVVWIREVDPNRASVPPGMGVRFDKLSPESQAVLEQLLVEKAKRERGGTAASVGQGMAVRRPSSMFSVLEPQVSVAEGASGGATTTATATTTSAPPAPAPDKRGAAAGATAGKTEAPASAYRPLGTARNPFSSPPAGEGAKSGTPAPTSTPSSGPRPLADLLPLLAKTVAPVAPAAGATNDDDFDDLNEEPTQIAGRLPSFLTSDSEATTEVPADLAASVKTAAPLPFDYLPGASPDTARPATRAKSSLDEAPPEAAAKTDAAGADAPRSDSATAGTATGTAAATTSGEADPAAAPGANTPASADSAKDLAAASTTATAAKTPPAKKRSATPVVAAVLVLGVSAIFLYKFFGSQSSENVTSAPTSGALPTITGEPSAPAPAAPTLAAPEPTPAPVPTAAPAAPPPAPMPVEPAKPGEAIAAENKPAAAAGDNAPEAGKKSTIKRKVRTGAAAPTEPSAAAAAPSAPGDTAGGAGESSEAAIVHQIRVTSKPTGADVLLDGQTIGKSPLSTGIADVSAPHSITIRKDGFEPFEQMIGASSAWSKSKVAKGKPPIQVLKLNAKLKQIGGGAAEGKPSTEPPAAEASGDSAAKTEAKPDRPLPPSDVPAGESPPP